LCPNEVAIQFFNLRCQIAWEKLRFDTSIVKEFHAESADVTVRIEHSYHNASHISLHEPSGARDFWMPSCSAGFEGRVNSGSHQDFIRQLPFQSNIFRMRFQIFSAMGLTQDFSVFYHNCTDFRMRPFIFCDALSGLFDS